MSNTKLINLSILKTYTSGTRKRNTLNKSTSRLLQPTTNMKDSIVQTVKDKNNLKMAFRKIKQCLLMKRVQTLITILVLYTKLEEVSADARKFQDSDITTNIITDPKSVASIDFRSVKIIMLFSCSIIKYLVAHKT